MGKYHVTILYKGWVKETETFLYGNFAEIGFWLDERIGVESSKYSVVITFQEV